MTMTDRACEYGCSGILTIGGYPLNTPSWDAPSLSRLWAEASIRGENKLLPGAQGRRSYPTRLDQSEHDLAFFIYGNTDLDGTLIDNAWQGLQAHLDALWSNVFAPVTVGRGVRAATLTMPSGVTRVANVQVEPLHFANDVYDASFVEATIHLTIVDGRFH
jgi:hypothetical protein